MTTAFSKTTLYNRMGITSSQLEALCQRWQIAELALFGSILRDDFQAESDIDVLVTYQPAAYRNLFTKMALKEEFEDLLQRNVDVVSKQAIEQSRNWIRRKSILDSAEVVYVA